MCGCHSVAPPSTAALDALLKSSPVRRDQVVLEVYQVRVPPEQVATAAAAWAAVDEQFLDADLRTRLLANGLRAGVVGNSMPAALAGMLQLADEATDASAERVVDEQSVAPPVTKQIRQLVSQQEMQTHVGPLRESLDLLISDETVHGQSYAPVQPTYLVKASPESGQRVRLQVTPELQHGDIRNRVTGGQQGAFMFTASRDREPFPALRIEAELAPGDALLLGGLDDAPGSLGAAFHAAGASGDGRLVLIRVAKVPESEILAEK
ncbi:MAG: hypothetical protein CMJ58_20095 [Planctomycetaceae bacterium]|nr:hypothetical protein [Planctomycetaceae bacterium]